MACLCSGWAIFHELRSPLRQIVRQWQWDTQPRCRLVLRGALLVGGGLAGAAVWSLVLLLTNLILPRF